jgi:hypothetical protein
MELIETMTGGSRWPLSVMVEFPQVIDELDKRGFPPRHSTSLIGTDERLEGNGMTAYRALKMSSLSQHLNRRQIWRYGVCIREY